MFFGFFFCCRRGVMSAFAARASSRPEHHGDSSPLLLELRAPQLLFFTAETARHGRSAPTAFMGVGFCSGDSYCGLPGAGALQPGTASEAAFDARHWRWRVGMLQVGMIESDEPLGTR